MKEIEKEKFTILYVSWWNIKNEVIVWVASWVNEIYKLEACSRKKSKNEEVKLIKIRSDGIKGFVVWYQKNGNEKKNTQQSDIATTLTLFFDLSFFFSTDKKREKIFLCRNFAPRPLPARFFIFPILCALEIWRNR